MNSALSEYYELVELHQAVVAQRDGLLDMNQYTTQENHALGSQLQQRNVEIAQIRAVLAKKDERIAELEAKNQEFMTHAAAQASKICRLQDCLTVLGEENVELRAKLDQSDNLQPEEGQTPVADLSPIASEQPEEEQAPVADLSPIASEQPEEVPAYVADPLPVVQATEDVLTVVRDTLALISQAASQIGQELVTAKAELEKEIMFKKVKEVTIRREKANEEKKLRQKQEAEEKQRVEESRKADRARRQEAAKERKIAEKALKAKQREENKQKLEAKCVAESRAQEESRRTYGGQAQSAPGSRACTSSLTHCD